MNDNESPLNELIICVVCRQTMKLEKVYSDSVEADLIQYRCRRCGRIELLRLTHGKRKT
jgi:hypothetical protein